MPIQTLLQRSCPQSILWALHPLPHLSSNLQLKHYSCFQFTLQCSCPQITITFISPFHSPSSRHQCKKKKALNSSSSLLELLSPYGKYADIVSLCICLSATTHCPWSSTKIIPTVKVQFKSGWIISSSQHITFSEAPSNQTTVLQM